MCALLGLSFAEPIFAGFSFREFSRWSDANADGWGLAWYPDQSAALIKEPVRWQASAHSAFLDTYQQMCARVYLGHIRQRTTGGEPTHADTHPFQRELGGRDYCFAHNGTIERHVEQLTLDRFQPVGSTDSERLFCHLLEEMAAARQHPLDAEPQWRWLHQRFLAVNRWGKMNCLLTDGRRLFCYRDRRGWKGLAFTTVYILGQGTHHFEDATVKMDLEGQTFNRGIIVATQPLNSAAWRELGAGELLVLENGAVRFSTREEVESQAGG
jgi:predicted glutamine amidotransferase